MRRARLGRLRNYGDPSYPSGLSVAIGRLAGLALNATDRVHRRFNSFGVLVPESRKRHRIEIGHLIANVVDGGLELLTCRRLLDGIAQPLDDPRLRIPRRQ